MPPGCLSTEVKELSEDSCTVALDRLHTFTQPDDARLIPRFDLDPHRPEGGLVDGARASDYESDAPAGPLPP